MVRRARTSTSFSPGRAAADLALVAVIGLVGGVLGGGCASKKAARSATAGESRAEASAAAKDPPAAMDLSRPPVMSADAGLEATWLVAGAGRDELARALTPYLSNTIPADLDALGTWEANGLRIVRVPMTDWGALSASLRVSGASQRQWLGQTGEWTEIVRGPEAPRGQIIALDAERLELGPGSLRLLSRCWLTPVPPESPGQSGARAELVIELMPQLLEGRCEMAAPSLKVDSRLMPAIDRGMSFDRLALRLRMRGGAGDDASGSSAFVLLVLAERPGVDWMQASESDEAAEPEDEAHPAPGVGEVVRNGSSGAGARAAKPDSAAARSPKAGPGGAGPSAPLLRTLGEAMFAAPLPSTELDDRPVPHASAPRSLLVLIPHVPASFRLLPDAPGVGGGGSGGAQEARPAAPGGSGRAVGAVR